MYLGIRKDFKQLVFIGFMDIDSKQWFEKAYSLTQGVLPFGYVTGEITIEEVSSLFPEFSPKEVKNIVLSSYKLHSRLPKEEDFIEEKERVITNINPLFIDLFPYADSAVTFGAIRGDLDIGLISRKYTPRLIANILNENISLMEKFPIVDWNALYFFVSPNGRSLAEKIIQTREIILGKERLPLEKNYIKFTFNSSRLLWGDEEVIKPIKNYDLSLIA